MSIQRIIFAAFLVLLIGCASSRKGGLQDPWEPATPRDISSTLDQFEQAEKLWKNRHIEVDLKKALSEYEEILVKNPTHRESILRLARGYYILGDFHAKSDEDKKSAWEKGTYYGEKALALNEKFRELVLEEKKEIEDSLDVLKKKDTQAIYWTAVNLGKWSKLSGIATILKYKARVQKMLKKVQELDSEFFYGAAHRYWGVYYAVAPFFAGGDLDKSFEEFQKAIAAEKNYLGTHVLFAENYASRKGDKELFKKELNFVLQAKPDAIPELFPEQFMEQKRAQKMLTEMDRYF